MTERVVVVGGGVAGLVVARDVAAGGRDVVLLEASDRLGGQLARLSIGGIATDAAAESFARSRSSTAQDGGAVERLAIELGLGPDIVPPLDAPAWLMRADGSSVPLPATSILGVPGIPLAADVVAAIGMRAALRASLDLAMVGQVGARSATLGELVRKRMGRGVLDGLVAPVVRGVHSTSPDDLPLDRAHPGLRRGLLADGSLQHAVRTLRERSPAGSQVAGIRGGVVRIVDELAADLERFGAEVRTGARVRDADADGVALENGERIAGTVVLAAPGLDGAARTYRRITLVTLLVDAPELDAHPRGTGVLVAEGAPVAARALTHATAKWAWLAERAGGRHLLRISYDERPADPAERARADASTLLGAPLPEPEEAHVADWTRVVPGIHAVDGMHAVGEAGSETGLAAVVAGARELAGRLLATDGSEPAAE